MVHVPTGDSEAVDGSAPEVRTGQLGTHICLCDRANQVHLKMARLRSPASLAKHLSRSAACTEGTADCTVAATSMGLAAKPAACRGYGSPVCSPYSTSLIAYMRFGHFVPSYQAVFARHCSAWNDGTSKWAYGTLA